MFDLHEAGCVSDDLAQRLEDGTVETKDVIISYLFARKSACFTVFISCLELVKSHDSVIWNNNLVMFIFC